MWSDKGHTEVTKVEVGHEGFYATLAHCSRLVARGNNLCGTKTCVAETLCDCLQICEIGVICGFKFGI
jgi:hypothetical protein